MGILFEQLRLSRRKSELQNSLVRDCLCLILCLFNSHFFMHPSPHFIDVQLKLNNNHFVGFIMTKVAINAGEELLWKYTFSQAYRNLETPPSPSPAKRVRRDNVALQAEAKQRCPDGRVFVESSARIEGCRCINPCSSSKNCLTPNENLPHRIRLPPRDTR